MSGMIRTERCVCGGSITADDSAPGLAVAAHNRSPRHEAWRLGLRVEVIPTVLPAADGRPVLRLGPAEAFGRVA